MSRNYEKENYTRYICERGNRSFCDEEELSKHDRKRYVFVNDSAAWFPHGKSRVKRKEGYMYAHIPGAEFKIHVNIIRLAVHFLEARLAVHRTTNERGTRIDASISSVVDRRRHELYTPRPTGGGPNGKASPRTPRKSHLRAWLPVLPVASSHR